MRTYLRRFVVVFSVAALATVLAAPSVMHAGMGSSGMPGPSMPSSQTSWTQATQSYNVELDIEQAQSMSMSMGDQSQGSMMSGGQSQNSMSMGSQPGSAMSSGTAMGSQPSSASSGMAMGSQQSSMNGGMAMSDEVMVAMPGMAMPQMTATDQGQPVNHHLEVHIKDASTGAVLTNQVPTISITDAYGGTRTLSSVVAMYDPSVGQSDMHFGNNVYLPDGTYTVTATIGGETATFANVAVSGGAPVSSPGMAPGS